MPSIVTLLLAAHAHAAPAEPAPFAWSWPTTPTHWHVEAANFTPRGVRYRATDNAEGRAGQVDVRTDVTCTFAPAGKNRAATCTFDWLQLKGGAIVDRDQAGLDIVMKEWSEQLGASTVTFTLTPDGRMKAFDVTSRERQNLRDGAVIEAQRNLAQRIFCLFDLPVGADGADWKRGWKHKGDNQVLKLQTVSGTAGAAEVKRRRDADRFGLITVIDEGKAILSPGGAVDSAGTRLIDVTIAGESLLDAADGTLAFRSITLDGRLTASSLATGVDAEFYFIAGMQRLAKPGTPGEAPLPIGAQRAPRLSGAIPDALSGATVPFASLGMDALFVKGLPDAATALQIPTTKVKARVAVDTEGRVTQVTAYEGFAVLGAPTEEALRLATFPKREGPYTTDVELEWREAPKAP